MFLEEYADDINQKLNVLGRDKNILIWGAGESAVCMFRYTELSLYNISYIVDKRLYGQFFWGKTVMKPDDIPWDNIDAVIITAYAGKDDIRNELSDKYGFKGIILALHDGLQIPFYKLVSKSNITPADDNEASVLQKNNKYKNIHADERVFIICTGPSINKMDLTRLKNEKTIAVNSFYLHKDCRLISPDYYCVPAIKGYFTSDVGMEFLREIQRNTLETDYFFSIRDKQMIESVKEYEGVSVNYMSFSSIPNYENADIDLTGLVMGAQSASIMALEMALYMGFREIYLLGTEHDVLTTRRYTHFYSYHESIASKAAEYENAQGDDATPFNIELECVYNLWNQYKIIKKIAERRGVSIYNATRGGILDVFERVDYNNLF